MVFLSKISIVIGLLSICISTYANNQQWEYLSKTIVIQSDQFTTQRMNSAASEGWELVDCESDGRGKLICIFKRPR